MPHGESSQGQHAIGTLLQEEARAECWPALPSNTPGQRLHRSTVAIVAAGWTVVQVTFPE